MQNNFKELTKGDIVELLDLCSVKDWRNNLPTLDLTNCSISHYFLDQVAYFSEQNSIEFDSWLMHSKPYFDLVQHQIVTPVNMFYDHLCGIYEGHYSHFDKPVVVSDLDLLYDYTKGLPTVYRIYALVWQDNKLVPVFKVMAN